MRLNIDEAVEQGYIKPASELRLTLEEEDDYERGLVLEKIPEVLTRGHVASTKRVDLMEERASHAKYLLIIKYISHSNRYNCVCYVSW